MENLKLNTEAVEAILAGRKTVLRIVAKTHKDPPCREGDTLYVKETWKTASDGSLIYRAGSRDEMPGEPWKPSTNMPISAARLFLKVKHVSRSRLQDITIEDIAKEGAITPCGLCRDIPLREEFGVTCAENPENAADCPLSDPLLYMWFEFAWNASLSSKAYDSYTWDNNPYVWRIEFERM